MRAFPPRNLRRLFSVEKSPKRLCFQAFRGLEEANLLFPLESQNVFFSDFVPFLSGFCPDNPAHTAIFDSQRDFFSQYVASGYYAFLVRLNLIIPFEPLFPTIKRKGVCLCQSFYHVNSTSTPPASSCDMLTARFSASTLPESRTASIPP